MTTSGGLCLSSPYDDWMQPEGPATQEPTVERCYRHPTEETRVHCTRCGRPICPSCMIPAPVGHQCPECVAQARREFRQSPAGRVRAAGRFSATNVLLIAIGIGFVAELVVGGPGALSTGPSPRQLYDMGAMFPPALAIDGQYWRLLTSMFLHAGILHIGFNAYALYLFGGQVERAFGRRLFLLLYFLTGLLAGVASYSFGEPLAVGVGASGAIFGIFGVFIAYNYRRRYSAAAAMNLRWAWSIILINAILAFGIGTIDWRAHVGGLISGLAAGAAVDGIGPRRYRTAFAIIGLSAMAVAGVVLALWRTNQLPAILRVG